MGRWWRVEVEIMVMVKVTIAVKLWAVRAWEAVDGQLLSCGPAVACGRLFEEARSENRRENGEEDVRERILARM